MRNTSRGLAPAGSDAAPPRTYTADLEQWSQVRALAAKLAADRHPVDVLMVKGTGMNSNAGGLMRLTAPLFRPFAITPDEGVQTPI